jgi:D-tyrosyl-tRNA(Tyr) deacylase
MKALVQRVSQASVKVDKQCIGKIDHGMMILLGIEATDTEIIAEKLAGKLLKYRIFSDDAGKMNLNVKQVEGDLLVVSQFTLVADTQKGNRPGFSRGAAPDLGKRLYEHFVAHIDRQYKACKTGKFGADMQVSLINDGPVTFMIEAS